MKKLFWLLFILSYSCAQSNLTFLDIIKDSVEGMHGLDGAFSIAVTPDCKNAYVASYRDNALVAFKRDISTGALTYDTCFISGKSGVVGLYEAQSVVVSPDNKNVYVVGGGDEALTVFNRNVVTGALTYSTYFKNGQNGVMGFYDASSVIVSPDNKNVYVANLMASSLMVFNRDTSSGVLTFDTWFKDGNDSVKGLSGAHSVIVSPDNKNVYVAGSSALAVFNRNVLTGALAYSTYFQNGHDGVEGLEIPQSIAISPDNKNVYVACLMSHSLVVFNRDASTGALTYSTCFKDGQNGVDGLNAAYSVAVSPDNKSVYVAGDLDSAVAVFNRDVATGALAYNACYREGQNGINGMGNPTFIAVTPDNKNVYVIGSYSKALVVFGRMPVSTQPFVNVTSVNSGMALSAFSSGRLCTVVFTTRSQCKTNLSLYDARGRLKQKIFSRYVSSGSHTAKVDFYDLQSGIHFLSLANDRESRTVKIIIAK